MRDDRKQAHDPSAIVHAVRLLRPFWFSAVLASVSGICSGLGTTWVLGTINHALQADGKAPAGILIGFIALAALSVGGQALAGALGMGVSQRVIANLRKDVSAQVIRAPIDALERYRTHRVLAALNNDVDSIGTFTTNFPGYVIALAMLAGCVAYLSRLSPVAAAAAIVSVLASLFLNGYAQRKWLADYEQVRSAQDDLQRQYRAITDGAKELRLNSMRRGTVYGVLLHRASDTIAELRIRAMRRFWSSDAASMGVFFATIGALLAFRDPLHLERASISSAVLVLLYVKTVVSQLAGALPMLTQAQVALRRLATLAAALDSRDENIGLGVGATPPITQIESIALRAVSYVFAGDESTPAVTLGPVDLHIRQGETIFIVGENGSGKTTLIKLLLGLYEPASGSVVCDAQPVLAGGRDDYRQLFTTVLSDYYLFDDIVHTGTCGVDDAAQYLQKLGLADKVEIRNGRFSTTDLSTGQRKRLALVHAYLEQRPVIVFDEWAADQDPAFRHVFYHEILSDLKRRGKTLIVISHDDRYFGVADRIVRLQRGMLVDTSVSSSREALSSQG